MEQGDAKRSMGEDESELSALQKAIRSHLARSNYAKSLPAAIKNPSLLTVVQLLRLSTYKSSLNDECTHVVPSCFEAFDIVRDRTGKIISIQDDNEKLEGIFLKTILALEAAKNLGSCFTILEVEEDHVKGLMVPAHSHIVPIDAPAEAEKKLGEFTLYVMKSRCISHLTNSDIVSILSLPQASLGQVQPLLTALDKVKEVDQSFEIEPENLSSLTHLRGLLSDVTVKERQRFLYSKLLSLRVVGTSYEQRISEFVQVPSLEFAQNLKLGLHHSGELFSSSTKRKAGWVSLASLEDDRDITMSIIPIDAKGYSLVPKADACRVIPWADDYAVKSGNRFREVGSIFKTTAGAYRSFLNAVAQDMASKKPATRKTDESEKGDDGKKTISFNL